MKTSIIFLFLFLLVVLIKPVMGQQPTPDTTGVGKLSQALSISQDKAIALKAAMQSKQAEITNALSEHTVNTKERQKRLQRLMAERDSRINALLTPQQVQILRNLINSQVARQRKERNKELRQLKQVESSKEPVKSKLPYGK
jgi:predicted Abi (CAAX) family protease